MWSLILILCVLQLCYAHDDITNNTKKVKELVDGIEKLNDQMYTWKYSGSSDNYKSENYVLNGAIYDGHFDFIICGAGTAGSLLTNRLAKNPAWSILLLEAGESENDVSNIPKMARNLKTSSYNWGYFTEPQRNGFGGYINNTFVITAGKALGGSTVSDTMTLVRGNKEDYNKWGLLNPGWSYRDVLPIFKKLENTSNLNFNTNYRGREGEIKVNYGRFFNDMGQAFLDSFIELGKRNLDYNAESQLGASRIQLIQNNGQRETSAKIFLEPVQAAPNLQIFSNTLVTKVLIDKNLKKSFGVEYVRNGAFHYATASKEVILSLGAINTPQILMLSGVGPADHLQEHNIDVIKNLPVGCNLWDQLIYIFQVFRTNTSIENIDLETEVIDYLDDGSGSLTAPFGNQATAFSKLRFDLLSNAPDVQYSLRSESVSIPVSNYTIFENVGRFTEETYIHNILPTLGIPTFSMDIVSLHPSSRGKVLLKSNSPFDFPKIDPNYFSDSNDIKVFVKAIRETFKIANTQAFKKYNSTFIPTVHPNCETYIFDTDDFWECMIKTISKSRNIISGTAKMGPFLDPTAVVNHALKVHGIDGLRVADSSVIPTTISGTTIAATYLIAQKASELIISEYM